MEEEKKNFSLDFKYKCNILFSVLSYSHYCIVRYSNKFLSPVCQIPLENICSIPACKLILKLDWKMYF